MTCAIESTYLALFTFLAGALIGHRLSLFRDRRKERNEVALRLKLAFEAAAVNARSHHNLADWVLYLHLIGRQRRAACERLMAEYKAASSQTFSDASGQQFMSSRAHMKALMAQLATLMKLS